MVRFQRYGLTFIIVACCAIGVSLGYVFGVAGAVVGVALGGMAAGGVAMVLDTPDKIENAVWSALSVVFLLALVLLSVSFWDLGG